ncbi:Os06g0619650, partial [Oryza sativa Japonica Group]
MAADVQDDVAVGLHKEAEAASGEIRIRALGPKVFSSSHGLTRKERVGRVPEALPHHGVVAAGEELEVARVQQHEHKSVRLGRVHVRPYVSAAVVGEGELAEVDAEHGLCRGCHRRSRSVRIRRVPYHRRLLLHGVGRSRVVVEPYGEEEQQAVRAAGVQGAEAKGEVAGRAGDVLRRPKRISGRQVAVLRFKLVGLVQYEQQQQRSERG